MKIEDKGTELYISLENPESFYYFKKGLDRNDTRHWLGNQETSELKNIVADNISYKKIFVRFGDNIVRIKNPKG